VLGDWYRDAEEQSNAACSKSISFAKRSTVSTKSFELPNSKEFEKEFEKEKGKEKGKENIM
tara:strand:- start:1351 stop:1533 length:183 start_codon:yes stop_codon:yes gene_type:complete